MRDLGYEILARNFHSKFGEIDIIAKNNNCLHFIEVKATNSENSSIYRITKEKLNKIVKTIDFYFLKNNFSLEYEIDAICIDNEKIEFLQNISL